MDIDGWGLAKFLVWLAPLLAWEVRDRRHWRRELAADPRPDWLKPAWWVLRREARRLHPPLWVFALTILWSVLFLVVIP